MSGVFKRTLTILLVFLFLLSAVSVSPLAAECTDKPEEVLFSFLNADSSANISASCYYSDEYFYQSGMKTDTHLRTLSLCMAMAAFESFRETEDFENRCENIEDLLQKTGFSDLFHNEAYDTRPTQDTIGIAIGSKKINVFGIEYTLLAVGIRGASYGAEWASNMLVGESGHAAGFSLAAEQVLSCIRDYEAAHGITDHAKIWVCGFSRAGAVANLVGETLNRLPLDYATTKDDIYCYTFEAPQGADKTVVGQYPNIHNTISTTDMVPLLPFPQWGLSRVGYPQEGQDEPYSLDDLLLPAPGTEEYAENVDTMLSHLSRINPELEYAIENFSEFRFDLTGSVSDTYASQSSYVTELSRWLNSILPEQSRASYAENYEESFTTFSRIMLSTPAESMSMAQKALVKDPVFYGYLLATVVTIQTRGLQSEENYEASLRELGQHLGETLVKHMTEAQIVLSEEDTQALIQTVYPIIRFLDSAIEDDVQNYGGYHLATLLSNLKPIIQAHCPEVILAWLETYDSYYTPSRFTAHQFEYKEEKAATCTQNGHTAYWICDNCEAAYSDPDTLEQISVSSTILPATGHRWNNGVVTRAATEKRPGERTFTCLNCGEIKTEEIERLPITPRPTETPEVTVTDVPKEAAGEETVLTEPVKKPDRDAVLVRILILILIVAAIVLIIVLFTRKKRPRR